MRLRRLTAIEDYRRVLELEQQIWGYTSTEDAVPVPIMIVTGKIGGLLLGAFDEAGEMIGFVYSLPGIREGKPFQWSHMLGVVESHRGAGVAWLLKLEQRRLLLEMGIDLVEWTFDPLQAVNAHLNLSKLGAVAREYHLDVYGDSSSPLHQETPTDRFIAEWWLKSERVEQRLATAAHPGARRSIPFTEGTGALVNAVTLSGRWIAPRGEDLLLDADRLGVVIPAGFTDLQREDHALASEWRHSTRRIFETYLPRGYEVSDFTLDLPARRGVYLLERRAE